MRLPKDPVFDVALLLADVRVHRGSLRREFHGSRAIAERTGMPLSTVQLHLRPSYQPGDMTVDHAMRWMLWLGVHDIREYQKEIDVSEGEL